MGQKRTFDGRRVLVVGGAHGIGAACAARFSRDGAQVAVADLDLDAARATVVTLAGVSAAPHLAVQMDITDRGSVDAAVAEVVTQLGGLDVLANVAGGDDTGYPAFDDLDDEMDALIEEVSQVDAGAPAGVLRGFVELFAR